MNFTPQTFLEIEHASISNYIFPVCYSGPYRNLPCSGVCKVCNVEYEQECLFQGYMDGTLFWELALVALSSVIFITSRHVTSSKTSALWSTQTLNKNVRIQTTAVPPSSKLWYVCLSWWGEGCFLPNLCCHQLECDQGTLLRQQQLIWWQRRESLAETYFRDDPAEDGSQLQGFPSDFLWGDQPECDQRVSCLRR